MPSTARQAVAPAYLLLCLVLGGSAQGIWSNLLLQLIGLAIIAWAAAARPEQDLGRPAKQLLLIVLVALAIVALQLVPLPVSIWAHLGARERIADGYGVLGIAPPPMPVSLAPYDALGTLLTVIPALGMLCAIVQLKAHKPSWLALALLAGTFAGILLGAMQVASADPSISRWYPYSFSNFGYAVGFFANVNHMAMLLVIAVPFVAALLASARGRGVQRYSAAVALAAGGALVIAVGIALNRSLAAYGLAVPVFIASLLIVIPGRSRARPWIAVGAVVLLAAAVTGLALSPIGERSLGTSSSVGSREAINKTTARAIVDFLALGSGLGTFKPVYKLYEDHDSIERTIVNHAHNDYAELALETGAPGIVLMLLFVAWWGINVRRAWLSPDAGPYVRAASIASGALLAHSLVDFPLRTAALGACFAMCLALLAERRAASASEASDLRPTRHIVLG